jgi:hypothetical protein
VSNLDDWLMLRFPEAIVKMNPRESTPRSASALDLAQRRTTLKQFLPALRWIQASCVANQK